MGIPLLEIVGVLETEAPLVAELVAETVEGFRFDFVLGLGVGEADAPADLFAARLARSS